MKLLVLGDFHGKFPGKFKKLIKREKIDFLISNGDYLPFSYRKLWFKHCYAKKVGLWEAIGKKKYKKLVNDDLNAGERVLKIMNKLDCKVITVLGNIDYPIPDDVVDMKDTTLYTDWKWDRDRIYYFGNLIKKYKNIKRIDYSYLRIGDLIFIGARGHSAPGKPRSKAFKKHKKILERLFKKFRKENEDKKVIFVSHNVPCNTKLDKIRKKAHKLVRGRHYGSKLIRRIIDKYQPVLHIGGHIHESRGMQKLERTICINPGSAHEGKGAIVDIPENKGGKIKVNFIK